MEPTVINAPKKEKIELVKVNEQTNLKELRVELLEPDVQRQLHSIEKKLAKQLEVFGSASLKVGELLAKAQSLLQTRGLFVGWLNTLPGMSIPTAYRMIARYEAAKNILPQSVVQIAAVNGIEIAGHTAEKPYGRYTETVKKLGPPPRDADAKVGGNWLRAVMQTHTAKMREKRAAGVTVTQAIEACATVIVRFGKKLDTADHAKFLVEVFQNSAEGLGIANFSDLFPMYSLKHQGRKTGKLHWTQTPEGREKLRRSVRRVKAA